MIIANQFRAGITIVSEGEIYSVIEFHSVKPGKGGAFIRSKLRNLRTKKTIEKTFRSEERFEEAFIENKKLQYLYNSGDTYHFMDGDTFEEIMIAKEKLTEIVSYLKENMDVSVVYYNNEIIEVELPIFIVLKIEHTEPGIKGDTAKGSFKPAILETGATIQVPLFINENDVIKIDTRSGSYVERVNG
ncbi:MAG: elongation factor P [Candidatus Omnitrophota bacterium]